MTCKDCIHCEACERMISDTSKMFKVLLSEILKMNCDIKYDSTNILSGAEICQCFQDRARFVELPCKVGDTVYFNNVHLRYAKVIAIYIDASGGMFDLDVVTNIETVAGYEHFINKDYTFEDIGKRLFLTKEAAEQALKERESNE